MRLISLIEGDAVIEKILRHLDLWEARPVARIAARRCDLNASTPGSRSTTTCHSAPTPTLSKRWLMHSGRERHASRGYCLTFGLTPQETLATIRPERKEMHPEQNKSGLADRANIQLARPASPLNGTMKLIGTLLFGVGLAAALTAQEPASLLADPVWEYRLGQTPWSTNLPAAAATGVAWPRSWRTFTRWEFETGTPARDDDPAAFTNVPAALTLNGISACRASLPNYGAGILDLTVGQGAPGTGRWAYVFGEVKAERETEVVLHTAASGPSQFWLDGQPVTKTPLRIRRGTHVLAGRVASGPQEWNLAGVFLPVGVEARRTQPAAPALALPARKNWPTNTLARQLPVTVALVGDPQSGAVWHQNAQALSAARPDALIIIGDLVKDGLSAAGWQATFFEPAANLLPEVPWLAVLGNHDRRAGLFGQFGGSNWAVEIGGALFVGIDGGLDWSSGRPPSRWLEQTLAGATNRWKFVVSHYPAYSSRNHGKLADDGRVLEYPSRMARQFVVPLLEKHGVTALFCGHDHGYERSELPSGLTTITTAGGGAGLYQVYEDGRANLFAKVVVDKHHYSLLRIGARQATFTAVTAEGSTIDTRAWPAD